MTRRVLGAALLVTMTVPSACSTPADYPAEWHGASDAIHVFGSLPARSITVPAGGAQITLLDVILDLRDTGSDLSRVVVFRRSGSDETQLTVDVRAMLLTGDTSKNILMRPGDVVAIGS